MREKDCGGEEGEKSVLGIGGTKRRGWAAERGVKKRGAGGDVKRALRRELAAGGGRGVWINLIRGGGEQSAGVGEAPVEKLKAN